MRNKFFEESRISLRGAVDLVNVSRHSYKKICAAVTIEMR